MDWKIGAIAKHGGFAWPALKTVSAAESFAERIAGHYTGQQPVTVSRLELLLAEDAPTQQVNYFQSKYYQRGPEISISPVAIVGERETFTRTVREVAARSESRSEAPVVTILNKIFSRSERIAAFDASREEVAASDLVASVRRQLGAAPVPEAVERILSRPAVEKTALSSAQRTGSLPNSSDEGWGTPLHSAHAPRDTHWTARSTPAPDAKPATLSTNEIRRVTEQVIREIDHRVVAQRERLGRR